MAVELAYTPVTEPITAVSKVTMSKNVLKIELLSFVRNAKFDSAGKNIVRATQVTDPINDMNKSKCGTVLAAKSIKHKTKTIY